MKIERPLMPGFLKRAEQKLLLNKPGVWSTRTHLVVYYGVLFILALAGLCFLEPADLREYTTGGYWVGFVIIISIIALTVWLIYLLRFNVFKKYGQLHPLSMLAAFGLYFISVAVIVSFVYVHPVVESIRANMAYKSDELVDDINAINLNVGKLEYNALHVAWKADTVMVVKNKEEIPAREHDNNDQVMVDSVRFSDRLATTDSLIKINESTYVLYKTPEYTLIRAPFDLEKYATHKILNSFEIYKRIYQTPQSANDSTASDKELALLLQKYHPFQNVRYYDAYEEEHASPFEKVHRKYQLYNVSSSFANIATKKYRWTMPELAVYLRVFYYFTLGITLLIFIFRHSTTRTFFLSLLAGVLLTIFTAMMFSFISISDASSFTWLITYFILFFLGSLRAWSIKKRRIVTGIMINLFVFLTPVFPLLIFSWYVESKRAQFYDRRTPAVEIMPDFDKYLIYVEVGGALLLLILLATYIGKLYRRWYSLPEE